jgi:hypothetical protein
MRGQFQRSYDSIDARVLIRLELLMLLQFLELLPDTFVFTNSLI